MAEWTKIGGVAQGADISAVSLVSFVTANFEYRKNDNASCIEDRILVPADHAGIIVEAFKAKDQAAGIASAKKKIAQLALHKEVANLPHTSTANFEGYRITRYAGFVTGTSTVDTCNGIFWSKSGSVESSINNARMQAIANLKQRAFDLNCNAVVGMDVDFVSVDSHGMLNAQNNAHYIVVCANGTAVEIEPIED